MVALFAIIYRTASSEQSDKQPDFGAPGLHFCQLGDSVKYTCYNITYFQHHIIANMR
jgi:hypothetical protein